MEDLVSNRKAHYHYEVLDSYEAGIALLGTEIKSLRDHGGSLQEAYVKVVNNELWLVGCHIAYYKWGNIHNHEEKRERKLLMHKKEISRIKSATMEKGLTVIPLAFYLKKGRVKVKLGLAKGKKTQDKRHTIKDREEKRRLERAKKFGQDA